MHTLLRGFVLAALAGAASPALAQAPGETIDVGGWKISHSTDDKGAFQGCTGTMTFDDGSVIGVAATGGTALLLISEPKSGLKPDQKYQIKYSFDNGKTTTSMGQATGADGMLIPVPDSDMDLFMSASTLHLSYGGKDFDEPLDGSKAALTAVAQCVGHAVGK